MPDPEPPPQAIFAPVRTIERWLGLPESKPASAAGDDHFEEARARDRAMAASAQVVWAKYLQRQAEYNRRRVEYHGDLKRKYAAAAARPWVHVDPDPPKPQ